MLRHFGQHEGGLLGYTRNVLREIVRLNRSHDFVFIYDNPGFIGTYGSRPNVREVAVSAPSRLVWDHLVVPYVARREGLDLRVRERRGAERVSMKRRDAKLTTTPTKRAKPETRRR